MQKDILLNQQHMININMINHVLTIYDKFKILIRSKNNCHHYKKLLETYIKSSDTFLLSHGECIQLTITMKTKNGKKAFSLTETEEKRR